MSITLLYSGATVANTNQFDPVKSLGNYPSISEIQNDELGNLFGSISRYTIGQNKSEYRAIVIKNQGIVELTNLKVYFENSDIDSDSDFDENHDALYEIGYVDLVDDGCGNEKFPYSITNPYSKPYSVSFFSAINLPNALDLPNLPADSSLGIWIKRTLKPSLQQPLDNETLVDILDGAVVLKTEEKISLTFSHD